MEKTIGDLTIAADDGVVDRGYSKPDGTPLAKDQLWKDNVFYEQDYFQIKALRNLRVLDRSGKVLTPIIAEVDVANSGYVMTFHSHFWFQGYVVYDNKISFAGLGKEYGYYSRATKWFELSDRALPGSVVSFDEFISTMARECGPPTYADSFTLDDLPRYMGLGAVGGSSEFINAHASNYSSMPVLTHYMLLPP